MLKAAWFYHGIMPYWVNLMKLHELHLKHVPFDDVKYPDYIYNDLGFAILEESYIYYTKVTVHFVLIFDRYIK